MGPGIELKLLELQGKHVYLLSHITRPKIGFKFCVLGNIIRGSLYDGGNSVVYYLETPLRLFFLNLSSWNYLRCKVKWPPGASDNMLDRLSPNW